MAHYGDSDEEQDDTPSSYVDFGQGAKSQAPSVPVPAPAPAPAPAPGKPVAEIDSKLADFLAVSIK